MSKTILLVQPPFGELYDIPFSTIATLTASLRAEGYTVIPRDLNVDFMHMIMNAQGATRICETMDRQIAALPDTGTDGPKQKKQLQVLVGGLRKKIPELDGIYSAFTREVRAGAVTPDTYKKANNAYIAELLSVAMVTKPAAEGWTFFDRVENRDANLYYAYFDALFADTPWDAIGLVGITVTAYSQMPGFSLAHWIRTRYPHVHIALGGDRFS
jgi:hypothetical protein